eukprot:9597427-Karenia_brevis.AAC.1
MMMMMMMMMMLMMMGMTMMMAVGPCALGPSPPSSRRSWSGKQGGGGRSWTIAATRAAARGITRSRHGRPAGMH